MKSLVEYLNEAWVFNTPMNDIHKHEGEFYNIKKIQNWLKKMGISDARINGDMTISTNSNVDLSNKSLDKLPDYIQFDYIGGDGIFDISNNDLSVLRGCPRECKIFRCKNNKKLRTLRGGPQIAIIYNCSDNNLKSLSGAPVTCTKFYCNNNPELSSLSGAPKKLEVTELDSPVFDCSNCGIESIEGLSYAPKMVSCDGSVIGKFKCVGNPGKITKYKAKQAGVEACSYVCDTDIKKL